MEKNKLPDSWESVSLSEISLINPPKPEKSTIKDNLEVSFIPMKNVEEITGMVNLIETREYSKVRKGYTYFQNNDIIFAKITPCMENGKIAIVSGLKNEIGFGSTEFHVVRMKDNISQKLYFWHLMQDDFRNRAQYKMTGTAGQRRVPTKYMKDVLIPLPPLNEQKRIVKKIEELFSKLNNIKTILIENKIQLKQYRQSLLKSAFDGNLTKKWRDKNKPTLQKEEIELWKKQRQNQYDEGCRCYNISKKPKLPEFKIIEEKSITKSWISMTLESIASFVVDCPHSTPKFVENGEYCIDTTCIEHSKIRWEDIRKVSSKEFQERISRMPIIENDIIFSREGTVGTSVLVPKDVKLCLGQRVMMFRFPSFLNPKFCELFLQSYIFRQQYLHLIGGSVAQHLNVGDIRKLKILIPTIKEQKQILLELGQGLSMIKNTENNIDSMLLQLDTLRSTISKQAFEGKLIPQDPNDEPASELLKRIKNQ